MPSIGTGTVDLRSILNSIFKIVQSKANGVCTSTCDGAVLKMHYRWSFFVFIACFFTVWYQWYHRDVITCVSHFNAETQVRLDYINICLSYPYLSYNEGKRYILFYRWVHWSMLIAAAVYYIPRKVSKNMENPKCKKLIEDLARNAAVYDGNTENILVEKVFVYMLFNMRTHNGLYFKYIGLNLLALVIDILTLHSFDFLLQGRFLKYGFNSYPFVRDPDNFSDYMSQTFPPFALCVIDPVKQIVNKREETFGCHLTLMELYEKVFLGLWLWLIILTFLTALYIVLLLFAYIPKVQEMWLRMSRPQLAPEKATVIINKVRQVMRVGDIYLLYRFKGHMSHAKFYELLYKLSESKFLKDGKLEPNLQVDMKSGKQPNGILSNQQPTNSESTKQRKLHQAIANQPSPEYMNKIYSNPEHLAKYGQVTGGDPALRALIPKSNTSILIE